MIAFGPFAFDPEAGALTREGQQVALGGRASALLGALVRAGGAVVGKADLMEAGWPGVIVEDGNLTVQVTALRKALGTREDGTEWITTVPRVGYRLVRTERPAAEPAKAEGPETRIPMVAVLPFQNLSGDPEQEYFADGVVEDIITALSRFKSLAVMARNSTFVFKGRAVDIRTAAADLGVRYVLEGSVRRAGERLRVSAQLIDGETGGHLWAQNYDGRLEDIFDMQDRITGDVASLVAPTVKDAELERARRSPPTLDVYDLYLRALSVSQSTRPGTPLRLIEAAERCLAIDPDFAPALALAASAHFAMQDLQAPEFDEAMHARGLRYARTALARAGNNADVRALGGMGLINLGREYEAGIAALRQAVADNPNSVEVLGHVGVGEIRAGDLDAAEAHFRRAIQFNPKSAVGEWLLTGMAHVRMAQRDFDDALAWATRSYAVGPHNVITLWMLTAASAHLGRLDEARRWLEQLLANQPWTTLSSIARGQHMRDPQRIEVILDGLRLAGLPE